MVKVRWQERRDKGCLLQGVVILLFLVFQHFFIYVAELDAGIAEHLFGFGTAVVSEFTDDVFDPAVDDEHGTGAAGGHFAIEG